MKNLFKISLVSIFLFSCGGGSGGGPKSAIEGTWCGMRLAVPPAHIHHQEL